MMQDFVHLHVHTYYSILDGRNYVRIAIRNRQDNERLVTALASIL